MNRPNAHPVCALIARMPFPGPRKQHQAIRPILPTAPARFMLNCLAHKGWSVRPDRAGSVWHAVCRLWSAHPSGRRNLCHAGGHGVLAARRYRLQPAPFRRAILSPVTTCLVPHGQVKTPLCLFMSGRGYFPLMVMFIPASRLTELNLCCEHLCNKKNWQ